MVGPNTHPAGGDADPLTMTLQDARSLVLRAQGMDGAWHPPDGAAGAAAVVERLGYVQIDTISVVERAHHHIVWARQHACRPGDLEGAAAGGDRLFEWWSWNSTAAYLPVSDYPLYAWHMAALATGSRMQRWIAENRDLTEEVLARIAGEGALGAAHFAAPEGFQGGGWWDWKPAKRALDCLFGVGRLMVSTRAGFQRRYDLPDHVLPSRALAHTPLDDEEAVTWLVRRLLTTQGLVRVFGTWGLHPDSAPLSSVLARLVDSGEIVLARIEGVSRPYYVLRASLGSETRNDVSTGVRILSPFDPLINDRRRFRELFSCDYRLECYLPASKRVFGYYMLPILWRGEIVGRMDAKALRGESALWVRRLELRPNASREDLAVPLAEEMHAYAQFNRCDEVRLSDEALVAYGALGEALASAV